ncbi:MAG: hypothetical protein AABX48_03265 [Nanoarchaeota archaeon]
MPKESKISTPDWIKEGYDSPAEYAKSKGKKVASKKHIGKTFRVRICPKCKSDKVRVVLNGEEGKGSGEWECKNCKWKGRSTEEKELSEDQFLEYLDKEDEE